MAPCLSSAVDAWSTSTVSGRCFCSESTAGVQADNTVLFTVVVIGRKVP